VTDEEMLGVDPRQLRVSDAEREHVVGVLQKAIGHGMLTLDEFTVRTDTALAAKTRAELNAVLVDLPGVVHTAIAPADPPLELRANMSKVSRTGRWHVPKELRVHNRLGSTELDFTEAVIDHEQVRVQLEVAGGSVKIALPHHASADTSGVRVTAGSVKDRSGGGSGRPRFVFTGTVTAGSLKIRRPSYVRIGNLVFRAPWKISKAADG
jgi:uncharacterized protein DUF1707